MILTAAKGSVLSIAAKGSCEASVSFRAHPKGHNHKSS